MINLIDVVHQQRAEIPHLLRNYNVSRGTESDLMEALGSKLIKAIIGPRRAGKSTLALKCLADKRFGYVNFEDNSLPADIDTNELMAAVDTVYETPQFLLFDEIQVLPRWEQFLNTLHRKGRNVVVTGSNSQLLSGELSSALTGRHIAIELLPLSFKECLKYSGNAGLSPAQLFDRYWVTGGFPEVAVGCEDARGYLTALTDSIILKDIVQRHKLRKAQTIAALIELLLEEPAARFSANNVSRSLPHLSLSVTTVLKYLAAAKEAYLLFELQPFYAKPRKRIKADRKIYVIDHAMAHVSNIGLSEKKGALLENLVFIELVRRGFMPNDKLFYFETPRGKEIDFLVKHSRNDFEIIQICYTLSSMKTLLRELDALTDTARLLNTNKVSIITYNENRSLEHDGMMIRAIPAWEWLVS